MEQLIDILGELGIEEAEAKAQIEELNKIITAKVFMNVMGVKEGAEYDFNSLKDEYGKRMQEEVYTSIAIETADEILEGYINSITTGLDDVQKAEYKERFIAALL